MNPDDYDEDGNNIVPCPLCSRTNCPDCYKDGKCPEEEAYARDMEREARLNDNAVVPGVECRCGWAGLRSGLEHEVDLETVHPHNRNNPRCNMMDRSDCHYTAFEKCPKCKTCLFADGKFIG